MNQDMMTKLRRLLISHEGYRFYPYLDTSTPPRITIAIGRNLSDRPLFPTEIELMYENDVNYFYGYLSEHYEWFQKLNPDRQMALVDMCFMGTKPFGEFKNMINYLASGDYEKASEEILNSEYHKEVGKRAEDIAQIIKVGYFL